MSKIFQKVMYYVTGIPFLYYTLRVILGFGIFYDFRIVLRILIATDLY